MIPETTATCFEVSCIPEGNINRDFFTIKVQYRGDGLWAVTWGGKQLGADGTWSWGYSWRDGTREPVTDDEHREYQQGAAAWTAAHRFRLRKALTLAEQQAPLCTVNGFTVQDVLAREGAADGGEPQ